jgi:two-component system, sensor histidine kinase PdtaS
VEGAEFLLPSGQATYVSLILNELIQNAVEHGLRGRMVGQLSVTVTEGDHTICVEVVNDGEPIAATFDLKQGGSLGLRIVQSLVRDNLMGEFSLITGEDNLTRACVVFPK